MSQGSQNVHKTCYIGKPSIAAQQVVDVCEPLQNVDGVPTAGEMQLLCCRPQVPCNR